LQAHKRSSCAALVPPKNRKHPRDGIAAPPTTGTQVSEIPVRAGVRLCPDQRKGDHRMASRPEIKVKKSEPDDTAQEAPNQKAKKEAGNYRLQVDRQTKAFYLTEDAAEAAGLVIKKGHPVVQVSIYNSAEGINKIIELPK
jgi:hypothetical protein